MVLILLQLCVVRKKEHLKLVFGELIVLVENVLRSMSVRNKYIKKRQKRKTKHRYRPPQCYLIVTETIHS